MNIPNVVETLTDAMEAAIERVVAGPERKSRVISPKEKEIVAFHEAGKVACALCHGTAILAYAKRPDGSSLVEGRTVTGFANVEEDFADDAVRRLGLLPADGHVMPWRIEDRLRALGANYVQAGLWRGFAVRDGNLVTGQQNFFGGETARAVIAALGG